MKDHQKEDDSIVLRRTTYHVISNPPPILPASSITQRKLSTESVTLKIPTNKSHSLKFQLENPPILKTEKYSKLYEGILKDMTTVHRHLEIEQKGKEKQKIKQSIAKVIRLNSEEGDFNERFGIKQQVRRTKSVSQKKRIHGVGFTSLEKQNQNRKSFFHDHRKVIGLEEECMLLQYYLKDEQNQKTEIKYLKGLEPTSKHRRITPTQKASFSLYNTHDQREYQSLKRRVHLKEQFVQKCFDFARKNSSYRRRENFREIEYVLKEHNKSLMEETIIPQENDSKERQKLKKNNKLTRLYLHYGFMSIDPKIQKSKTDCSLKKFKEDLWKIDGNFSFRELQIDRKIETIFQYKNQRVIRFQDFKEIILYLGSLFNKDILQLFEQKFPQNIFRPEDIYLEEHWHDIDRYFSAHKVKFLLELMFKTFPDKIIGKKVLPIKFIPSIFKVYGISEKDFKLEEVLTNYHWVQYHDAGLTFQEFYKGSILLQMKGDDWKGIELFLKKINIKKYL